MRPTLATLVAAVAALAASACSSGGGNAGHSGADAGQFPGCMNPTPAGVMCESCILSSCAPAVAASVSECGQYFTCLEACDCSATSCLEDCTAYYDLACQTADQATRACTSTGGPCEAACAASLAASDAGSGDDDAAASQFPAGYPTCVDPTSALLDCAGCASSACAEYVSAVTADCAGFLACFAKCNCSDASCEDTCVAADTSSSACASSLNAFVSCQTGNCASDCTTTGTSDGGDAGAAADSGD